jgi:hypothetical protein
MEAGLLVAIPLEELLLGHPEEGRDLAQLDRTEADEGVAAVIAATVAALRAFET